MTKNNEKRRMSIPAGISDYNLKNKKKVKKGVVVVVVVVVRTVCLRTLHALRTFLCVIVRMHIEHARAYKYCITCAYIQVRVHNTLLALRRAR